MSVASEGGRNRIMIYGPEERAGGSRLAAREPNIQAPKPATTMKTMSATDTTAK